MSALCVRRSLLGVIIFLNTPRCTAVPDPAGLSEPPCDTFSQALVLTRVFAGAYKLNIEGKLRVPIGPLFFSFFPFYHCFLLWTGPCKLPTLVLQDKYYVTSGKNYPNGFPGLQLKTQQESVCRGTSRSTCVVWCSVVTMLFNCPSRDAPIPYQYWVIRLRKCCNGMT